MEIKRGRMVSKRFLIFEFYFSNLLSRSIACTIMNWYF
ncbi:putative membrane protein [Helicobacter pylori UMB_G1]|nr:putative membrane protein [Helicobacter pylori UMB_G1]